MVSNNVDKLISFLFKHYKHTLFIGAYIFLLMGIMLCARWPDDATTFGDNILVEFIIGGLCTIFPIAYVVLVSNKVKQIQFYESIKGLIITVRDHRLNGGIKEPEIAREIIKEFARSIDSDILDDPWFEKKVETAIAIDSVECGICGLQADIESNKCKNCKLKCYAWQLPAIAAK